MSDKKVSLPSLKDVTDAEWDKLSQMKVFFGHQSVGNNIIKGIEDLMRENPKITLNIIETSDRADLAGGVFAHSRVGRNMEPLSKIDEFKNFMNNGLGEGADVAFFKFCYIDVSPDTDVEMLFNEYKKTLSELKSRYPETDFVHVTIPLMVVQSGPRSWVKRVIGRPIGGYADNIKRNHFNRLLIEEFNGKATVFDLAMAESTYPDGLRETFHFNGNSYYALIPEYSDDGRHLNEVGRKRVAEQLLILLAKST